MAALDFPNSPTVGQAFVAGNGVRYTWNGITWFAADPGATGDFCATQASGTVTATATTLVTLTVATGNSGGWFVPGTGRYTPPAGRYQIFAQYMCTQTAASHCNVSIRKNGSLIQYNQASVATSGYYCNPTAIITVDANGTDWFDMQVGANAGATGTYFMFGAFPISGIKGPPGDPPTAGGGIIREVTLASPAATIDLFDLPVVKSVKILFFLDNVSGRVDLRLANGSTVNTGSVYLDLYLYNASGNPGTITGSFSGAQSNGHNISGGPVQSSGEITYPSLAKGHAVALLANQESSIFYRHNHAFFGPANHNGFRFQTAGTFAAGSFVRVIGWP